MAIVDSREIRLIYNIGEISIIIFHLSKRYGKPSSSYCVM